MEGYSPEPDERPWSYLLTISPAYFQTLEIPIARGRDFGIQDDDQRPLVVMINEPFAERYWPGRDPVGRRVRVLGQWRTIVGVAPWFMMRRLNEPPAPLVFLPVAQLPRSYMTLMVRTIHDPTDLAPAVRRIIQEIDPQLPLHAVRTLERQVEGAAFPQRAAASMLSVFGALALALAAVGTYGVVAYNVAQRTRELGIRMALGAEPKHILRLVMGGGVWMVGLGGVLGLTGALVVARLLEPYLIGVGTTDVAALVGPVLLLSVAALVTCYLPAHRAMRVDPNIALRHE
ncbi:MAG: ABC transporter permease [Acidobacteriota bacterium]|nr:ABC transporter permease [Acidobacteriota bacterium]